MKCTLHFMHLHTQKNLSLTSKNGGWMPLKMLSLILALKRWACNFQFQKATVFHFLWQGVVLRCTTWLILNMYLIVSSEISKRSPSLLIRLQECKWLFCASLSLVHIYSLQIARKGTLCVFIMLNSSRFIEDLRPVVLQNLDCGGSGGQ